MKKSFICFTAFAAVFFAGTSATVLAEDTQPAEVKAEAEKAAVPAEETQPAEAKPEAEKAVVPADKTQPAEAKVEADKEKAQPTLFEQLGGEAAVKAAVDGFYDKVLADDRVNGFFEGVDMERQRRMQTGFLTFAFGGPSGYDGKNLRVAHAHLVAKGLNDSHFDIILEHLGATLKELGVKDELIQQAAAVANSVRHDVLGKEEASEAEEKEEVTASEEATEVTDKEEKKAEKETE